MNPADIFSWRCLGMIETEFEDAVDSLYRKSLQKPVPRAEVEALLRSYCVEFKDLSTWLRGKVGDIEVCD